MDSYELVPTDDEKGFRLCFNLGTDIEKADKHLKLLIDAHLKIKEELEEASI